jgi:hypothetical protein|tara:strand:+ start:85 stop:381 length:297 start_codon:yes stop_codon:yes gene_type:complete
MNENNKASVLSQTDTSLIETMSVSSSNTDSSLALTLDDGRDTSFVDDMIDINVVVDDDNKPSSIFLLKVLDVIEKNKKKQKNDNLSLNYNSKVVTKCP